MKRMTSLLMATVFAAGFAVAADAKTLVFCSEGSPEGFDPGPGAGHDPLRIEGRLAPAREHADDRVLSGDQGNRWRDVRGRSEERFDHRSADDGERVAPKVNGYR